MLIIWEQGYEDAIESMKIQFAAIAEEKAEVEHKLEPLVTESADLKKQMDGLDARKREHSVSPSCDLLNCWDTNSCDRHWSRKRPRSA